MQGMVSCDYIRTSAKYQVSDILVFIGGIQTFSKPILLQICSLAD